MIPKEIISKAIAGGWKFGSLLDLKYASSGFIEEIMLGSIDDEFAEREAIQWQQIALDSSFWQALGKVVMLKREKRQKGMLILSSPTGIAIERKVDWAEYTMHRFIDLILTGGDTDKFWDELLGTSTLS